MLALATLLPLPVIAFLVHHVRNRLRRGFALGTRAWGEMTSVLADTIPGIRVVKAFAQERREVERFRTANDRVFQANCRVNALWSFFEPVVSLLTALGLAVVWGYGAWRVFQHDLTVGDSDRLRRLHQPLLRPDGFDEPHGGGRAAGGGQRPADFRHSRPRAERGRAGPARPSRAAAGRGRVPRRGLSLRRPARAAKT